MMKKVFFLVIVLLAFAVNAQTAPRFITYRGQDLFLSGINLAWINFARDLSQFDEPRFVAALDEVAAARGNTLRWWLHTDGSASPVYGDDGRVIGLGENDIAVLRRAAALAYERGVLLMPTLWSHDMMNDRPGIPTEWNRRMIEDPTYTRAYIDNALVPLVTALAGHPGIVAWEIFNEPEGTTQQFGWTDERVTMASIQQFVNLLTGAIRRADPAALITNGSWNMRVLTDVGGMTNYYRDDRLIAAGGDPDGTLDFYSAHFYPEWFGDDTSPFHHPASYWELDKPLVIGEFPAHSISDMGRGFRPSTPLNNSIETYVNLYENGYAGALSWTFYASEFGSMADARPGMLRLNVIAPEHIQIDTSAVDRIPVIEQPIANAIVPIGVTLLPDYVDLVTVFSDVEDGAALAYALTNNTRPDLVMPIISESGSLSLEFPSGATGMAELTITATDSAGNASAVEFVVQVIDPDRGNVALGKPVTVSSVENAGYVAEYAVDGLPETRWSSEYTDDHWFVIDLGGVFTIHEVVLRWETAYGAAYDLQLWDGSAWRTIYEETVGDGEIDDLALPETVDTRYVRLNLIRRGTEWGFSLWEFEVYGMRTENGDSALETSPELPAAPPEPTDEPEREATLIHSFETDAEGWQLADYWGASRALTVTDAGALALSAVYTGGSWQEAGAFFQPGTQDWSSYTHIAMDIYLPEGAGDFIAQIFTKSGAEWAWANSADVGLTPGAWTTVTADLSRLGDLTAVQEYGIKVGTSVTAFTGDILIDNVRLFR